MCGIYGYCTQRFDREIYDWFKTSENIMSHRGPDDKGFWLNSTKSLGLGFNRLSIIDLTKKSNQPFINENIGISLVFNGEIYNFKELRNELIKKGFKFKTPEWAYSYGQGETRIGKNKKNNDPKQSHEILIIKE